MMPYVRMLASREKTRVLVTLGMHEALRATLPPLWEVKHSEAARTLLEALSLWADGQVCAALSADDVESCFRQGLIDELGMGTRSVFHAVEVVKARPGRMRATNVAEPSQLPLVGGQR